MPAKMDEAMRLSMRTGKPINDVRKALKLTAGDTDLAERFLNRKVTEEEIHTILADAKEQARLSEEREVIIRNAQEAKKRQEVYAQATTLHKVRHISKEEKAVTALKERARAIAGGERRLKGIMPPDAYEQVLARCARSLRALNNIVEELEG